MTKTLPYRVRLMEPSDIPNVVTVDRLVFRDPWPESAFVQELYFNANAHYFVIQLTDPALIQEHFSHHAARSSYLLGFVGMRVEDEEGHISTLAVRPDWHGRGLGELLLYTALNQVIKDKGRTVTLEVRITNYVAQGLYAKYGFRPVSVLKGYYQDGENAFLMRVGPLDQGYRRRLQDFHTALVMKLYRRIADISTNPK